jgi:putative transposase
VKGRKRHILVDTMGNILTLVIHRADIQDRDGAKSVLKKAKKDGLFTTLSLIWADGGYAGKLIAWTKWWCRKCILEIVKRTDDMKGFVVLPKRWIVERTFGWLGRYRRLAKDYEEKTLRSEAMIYLSMSHRMARGW